MTIHKAKGLEFDTVILPGLDRSPPPAQGRLLMWLERAGRNRNDLLLAPMAAHGDESSRTYAYIREFEKKKRAYEDMRLLYVAATRARKKLHLVGGARPGPGSGRARAPAPNSLLASLWPVVEKEFERAAADLNDADADALKASAPDEAPASKVVPCLRRLVSGWQPPEPPQGLFPQGVKETPQPADSPRLPPFHWAGEMVRRVGTVVHRWLRIICEQGPDDWSEKRVAAASERFRQDLRRAGVNEEMLDEAVAQVRSALGRTLSDPMGRWILSPHESGACEYALTGWIDKKAVHIIIDRTFVDEAGTRWIVDYKTGIHTGGSVEAFLEQEKERYQEQMHTYARIMQAMEDRPVGLLLYYPRLQNHRQWMASPPS
jgi:ATP-dependent exoDNAse (exonuclease V) beta subunit